MSTILVVDDMAAFREPLAASLRLRGYQTLTAGNGRQALDLAQAQPPDLILLDLAMPEMDGPTFLQERCRHERLRDIPVILLTAVAEERYVAEVRKLGVREYLLKSQFSMAEMVECVSQHLADAKSPPDPRSTDNTGNADAGADNAPSATYQSQLRAKIA